MAEKSISGDLRTHVALASAALLLLLFSADWAATKALMPAEFGQPADIAVEHSLPAKVRLEISTLEGEALVNIRHDAQETVYINVPESWKRQSVRNASLDSVQSEEPIFGIVRWSIPENAEVLFATHEAPQTITMHNPSKVPLSVRLIKVNLDTDETEQNVILIKDEPTPLW